MLLSLIVLALIGLLTFIFYKCKDQTIDLSYSVKIKFSLIKSLIHHDLLPLIPKPSTCKIKIRKKPDNLKVFLWLSKITPLRQKELENMIQQQLPQNLAKLTGYPGDILIAIRFIN